MERSLPARSSSRSNALPLIRMDSADRHGNNQCQSLHYVASSSRIRKPYTRSTSGRASTDADTQIHRVMSSRQRVVVADLNQCLDPTLPYFPACLCGLDAPWLLLFFSRLPHFLLLLLLPFLSMLVLLILLAPLLPLVARLWGPVLQPGGCR